MFVFKDEFVTAEHCGNCDDHYNDHYNEYRHPSDYGHGYKREQSQYMKPDRKLAEAYVPFQKWNGIYPPMEGLKKGTIFPELCRPYEKKGCAVRYRQAELDDAETNAVIDK